MKSLATTIISICAFVLCCKAQTQWATSGLNIYNSNTGNVGVGTTNPLSKFSIAIPANSGYNELRIGSNQASARDLIIRKNTTSPYDANIIWSANPTSDAGNLTFFASDQASGAKVVFTPGGKVGIGTLHPDQPLTVNGQVHSTEVVVTSAVPADYVFNANYYLRPLADVKAFVDKNHHLPEVPGAADFKKDGQNLGEMNMTLLKKVEELTLYLIEKESQIKALQAEQAEIQELKKEIQELKQSKK